jgi:hypothetical protein
MVSHRHYNATYREASFLHGIEPSLTEREAEDECSADSAVILGWRYWHRQAAI